jgi:hypothetical protein
VYAGRFFVVPREVVLDDIRALVAAGAEHITFDDPDFFNGPRHSMEIVRRLHAELPKVSFDLTTKVEHVLEFRRFFPELRELGCLFVVSAVESLNDEVLRRLEKGHTRADVEEALAVLREAGLWLRPSLVPFTPWSTLEDYLELLEFIEKHDLVEALDPVQLAVRLLLPPGSSLLEHVQGEPWLGTLDEAQLTWRWAHPEPRMDRLHKEVAAVVEKAAKAGEPAARTFHRIQASAYAAAGRAHPPARWAASRPRRMRPPRLTEDWFC